MYNEPDPLGVDPLASLDEPKSADPPILIDSDASDVDTPPTSTPVNLVHSQLLRIPSILDTLNTRIFGIANNGLSNQEMKSQVRAPVVADKHEVRTPPMMNGVAKKRGRPPGSLGRPKKYLALATNNIPSDPLSVAKPQMNGGTGKKRGRPPKNKFGLPLFYPGSPQMAYPPNLFLNPYILQSMAEPIRSLLSGGCTIEAVPSRIRADDGQEPRVCERKVDAGFVEPCDVAAILNGTISKDLCLKWEEAVTVSVWLDPRDWWGDKAPRAPHSHRKPYNDRKPYQCHICGKSYTASLGLKEHSVERHGELPATLFLACRSCPKLAATERELRRHLAAHTDRIGRLPCHYCLPPPAPRDTRPVSEEAWDDEEEVPAELEVSPDEKLYSDRSHSHWWFQSQKALAKHQRKKHPEAGIVGVSWFFQWGDR